jgi:hypothetical protein
VLPEITANRRTHGTTTDGAATTTAVALADQLAATSAAPLADQTVDLRVAATGGRRERQGDARSPYIWRGMARDADWRRTDVHHHNCYSCAKCGKRFGSPAAVYTHLAKVHPPTGSAPRNGRVRPAEGNGNGAGRVQ